MMVFTTARSADDPSTNIQSGDVIGVPDDPRTGRDHQ